jgi:hypothetical protein
VPIIRDFNKNVINGKYKENKDTHMPHSLVQWVLCCQNAGFNVSPFGLAIVGFLIK